jgi:hypothetical protein
MKFMTKVNKFLFQVSFVFLLLLTIPLDPYYYRKLFAHAGNFHFKDLFEVLDYVPFWGNYSAWGFQSFAGWLWVLAVSVIAGLIWFVTDKAFNYDKWNYILRTILRYRLAIALVTYGVILLFPLQVPFPSLSDLHTKYGDFLPWKIYYHSLGVASAGYEPILGFVEIFTGLLLLWRRTTVIGAGLAAALLINIVLVNFAYDLGSHVLSIYLLLISTVLLLHDVPRLYLLLVKEKAATADHYVPAVPVRFSNWAKVLFVGFFLVYAVLAYSKTNDKKTPGLAGAAGFYDVSHFITHGQQLPYSLTDTVRWQNVVFEKWNTLSVHLNKKVVPNLKGPDVDEYENEGNGGRIFYTYIIQDSIIHLINKNDSKDVYQLVLKRPDENTILLDGADIHVELNKINKTYLLHLGRRKPVKVY